ncbi:DUF5074 domain-containing protein [Gaoshiqia sediminis]|uniref:Surface layer protein n=1 Tax=Gaoshiqia sediminis TaxID=2986998 RepID=A0AA41Y496_9BACT|nr:DUF5074 domain-containing protein [Gaoshiqia sediminis]MCW0481560.1 hypothetical protein [Gaoshiqia sediminis]
MKKLFRLLPFLFLSAALFSSCSDDDDNELYPSELTKGAYVLNYGGYEQNTSSITKYNYEEDELTAFYYQQQNGGERIGSAPQYIYEYEDRLYLMNNNPDRVVVTDPLFVAQDTITTEIVKPRFCVASGNYLYISCWGGDIWTDSSMSYLVKYNVVTKTVEKKISLAGGPEGLAIANGKLYAALGYAKKIAVMNLATEAISYITTDAVSSYFVKDKSDNLYVSLVSSWSDPSTETGLGYINTKTDAMTLYQLDNVSTSYASIMSFSKDYTKLYVVAAGYDANWNLVGGVQVFNTTSKTYEAEPLVTGVTGLNGVSVNPVDGKTYVFVDKGSTVNGDMMIYTTEGELEATKTVGSSPAMAIFLD